jgi:hypothetical protein
MLTKLAWLSFAPIAVLGAVVACSDSTAAGSSLADAGRPSEASVAERAAAVDASAACPLEPSRSSAIRGRVRIIDGSREPPPASGARVCIHGRPDIPCVQALADGTYEHTCVPDGDVPILFSKEGVGSTLWLRVITAGLAQLVDTPIATGAENTKVFASIGLTYPRPGHGILTVNDARDSAGGGITFTALGRGADGPYYSSNGETIDRDAGPSTGLGLALFLAPAGNVQLRLDAPDGGACGQTLGGWGSDGRTITVPVLDQTETLVLVRCES